MHRPSHVYFHDNAPYWWVCYCFFHINALNQAVRLYIVQRKINPLLSQLLLISKVVAFLVSMKKALPKPLVGNTFSDEGAMYK